MARINAVTASKLRGQENPGQPKVNGQQVALSYAPAQARVPTMAEVMAQLDALQRKNAELEEKVKAKVSGGTVTAKVTAKGGIGVYGLGKFPVTLYAGQWERLLEKQDEIRELIQRGKDGEVFKVEEKDTAGKKTGRILEVPMTFKVKE